MTANVVFLDTALMFPADLIYVNKNLRRIETTRAFKCNLRERYICSAFPGGILVRGLPSGACGPSEERRLVHDHRGYLLKSRMIIEIEA